MDPRILELKRHAKELSAKRPQPAFCLECAEELGSRLRTCSSTIR